jgi:hypothetical protein
MTDLLHDIRFAIRLLRKSPCLAAIAVASLALGIGATTAVFSLMDALLLRPLPAIQAPSEVVSVVGINARAPERWMMLSWGDYVDFASRTDVISGLAAVARCDVSLISGRLAERVSGLAVSPSYFSPLSRP